jgi:hypothetical protein
MRDVLRGEKIHDQSPSIKYPEAQARLSDAHKKTPTDRILNGSCRWTSLPENDEKVIER